MNVLELIQAGCYQAGIDAPSSVVTSPGPRELQLRNLFYATGRELRTTRIFPQLKRKYTFNLQSGREFYQLPQDFYSSLFETQWDVSQGWPLDGPMTDAMFNWRLYGYASLENVVGYRIFGPDINPNGSQGQFQINPIPGATNTDEITFDYISKTWLLPPNWEPLTAYVTTGEKYNANGNIYSLTTTGTSGSAGPVGTGTGITDGTCIWSSVAAAYEVIISDTDLCLFDDDLMIGGLVWRFLRMKGMDYQQEALDFKRKIDTERGRWAGARRGNLGGGSTWMSGLNPNIPEGGF